jgi:hypothetical protein
MEDKRMKGAMMSMFKPGDRVTYPVSYMHDNTKARPKKQNSPARNFGYVTKLMKSGSNGSALIRPENGSRKVTRRLQLLEKAAT